MRRFVMICALSSMAVTDARPRLRCVAMVRPLQEVVTPAATPDSDPVVRATNVFYNLFLGLGPQQHLNTPSLWQRYCCLMALGLLDEARALEGRLQDEIKYGK